MSVPDVVWAPLAVGGMLLAVGLIGLAVGQPWLFPSLGPTAFLQAESPKLPAARPYNTIMGHLIGMGAGFLSVVLLGAGTAPGVLASHQLVPLRVEAAVLAVVLTMLGKALLKASHPPAAATTLLIALGGFRATFHEAGVILVGVLLIAAIGETFRQLRLRYLPPPA